jgi:LPS-assembly lipoprotein
MPIQPLPICFFRRLVVYGTVIVVLTAALSACGFRLRGQGDLPPSLAIVHVKTPASKIAVPSEFPDILKRSLEVRGSAITDDPKLATATIEIHDESFDERTLATSSDDEVRSTTLTYSVTYSVTLANGKQLLSRQQASATQDSIYAESAVLGRAEGLSVEQRGMMEDIANSILLRLQIAAS